MSASEGQDSGLLSGSLLLPAVFHIPLVHEGGDEVRHPLLYLGHRSASDHDPGHILHRYAGHPVVAGNTDHCSDLCLCKQTSSLEKYNNILSKTRQKCQNISERKVASSNSESLVVDKFISFAIQQS